ncbi:MAG: dihydrodipicolinate synthase family protein [Clostridia bacterium]|nr:dihydrodipicolinate synthase family protein [Clostridia bacterium]
MMKFEGIMPALVTPLTTDERINVPVLRELLAYFIEKDADGFYIGGATGEGLALRTEERMILAEESVAAVGGRKPCIIQVAATDFNDALALAKQAEAVGADAISATAPLFFKYSEDDVYHYYKALADAVHIPVMIYYNMAAGFPISAKFAARMFEVENITAIKWTCPDYYEMIRLKDLTHGEMNIINGPDQMLLMGLNAGADGGIGTTYNFMVERYQAIYKAFRAGNIAAAQAEQNRADRVIAALQKYTLIPATKAAMEGLGFAVGDATFPMKKYTAEEKKQIFDDLKAAGL